VIHKESEEFESQVAKLKRYMEYDLVQAVALLGRMAQALDKYVQLQSATAGDAASAPPPPPPRRRRHENLRPQQRRRQLTQALADLKDRWTKPRSIGTTTSAGSSSRRT